VVGITPRQGFVYVEQALYYLSHTPPPHTHQNTFLKDKPLANLTKLREKTQVNKIRNKKGTITTNTKEILRDYFENLYSNKLENLEEMNKFLETSDHPKLNQMGY
jgi:hypothetical protein